MSWTKIGDEFPAEARNLSDAAYRTHTEALCWSSARLLDLMIPKHEVRRFAETPDPITAIEELVDTGWWQDCGDAGWYIGCKFAEWQLDRASVEHRRHQLAEAQRRRRAHTRGDHALCLKSCKAATASSVDTPDDVADDAIDDPGRVGTGRETTTTGLEEQAFNETDDDIADDFNNGRRPRNWPPGVRHPSDPPASSIPPPTPLHGRRRAQPLVADTARAIGMPAAAFPPSS